MTGGVGPTTTIGLFLTGIHALKSERGAREELVRQFTIRRKRLTIGAGGFGRSLLGSVNTEK